MPRAMSSAMLAAVAAKVLYPTIFVEAEFASGPVNLWSGIGTIDWSGKTWTGIGTLGSISTITDGATVEARGIVLTLSGIDSGILEAVLDEFVLGLPVFVYFGLFNDGVLIEDPITSWAGRTDQPTIAADGSAATISINCENLLLDMNVAVDRRLTNDDQQRDWPGDLGLSFVNAIQDTTIYWGQSPTTSGRI